MRLAPYMEGTRSYAFSSNTIIMIFGLVEFSMIMIGGSLGPLVYREFFHIPVANFDPTPAVGLFSAFLYITFSILMGLYNIQCITNPIYHFKNVVGSCCIVILFLTFILFLLKSGSDFSRGASLGFSSAMLASCCIARLSAAPLVDALVSRDRVVGRPAFLIGESDELRTITPSLMLRQFGLQEVGRYALTLSLDNPVSLQRDITQVIALARSTPAQEFILALKMDRLEPLTLIDRALRASPLAVRLIPNHAVRQVIDIHAPEQDAGHHLVVLQRAPLSRIERAAKRLLDIAVSSFAMVVLLPILLITAIAVRWDSPGPVIFRQRRNGFNQRLFMIWKFRSMKVLEDGDKIVQAQIGDSRVTRVGRVLRRTSIDELPQLWNVLKGDMSIVGPRPHAVAHDDEYGRIIGNYSLRHHVKPGMTGWAQIHGFRGETTRPEQMQRRIDLDLWYINNWSWILDLRILVKTAFEVMKHEAY